MIDPSEPRYVAVWDHLDTFDTIDCDGTVMSTWPTLEEAWSAADRLNGAAGIH